LGEGLRGTEVLEQEVQANYEPSPRRQPTLIPISHPREWQAEVEVAADAAPGVRVWRVSCAQGGTGLRPFVVGELPEFIESESNSLPEKAERVTLPVTLNGQIGGERDLDYFVFSAKQGAVVVCDCLAARLGSPLDPILELQDAHGRRVEAHRIHVGNDPVLSFRVPRDGDYRLMLSHVSTYGGPKYVYRINLSTEAFVFAAFPAGGRAGDPTDVELLALSGTDAPRVIRERIVFPKSPGGTLPHRLRHADAHEISLAIGEFPESRFDGGNSSRDTAAAVTLPATINGRFVSAGSEAWYRLSLRKFAQLSFHCEIPFGSGAAPTMELLDASGKTMRFSNSLANVDGRGLIEWICPDDGEYFLRVENARPNTCGPSCIYRITAAPIREDFGLHLAADWLNILPGDKATLQMAVDRRGGFEGPIELSVEGLPPGVHLETTRIPAKDDECKLTLNAGGEARCQDAQLRIVGTALLNGRKEQRVADARLVGAASATTEVQLTVRHKPVFRLHCLEAYQYAHRGAVFPYVMEIERLDGYAGRIVLQRGDRQNRDMDGIVIGDLEVPRDAKQVLLPIALPETMHVNAQGQSQLYVQGYTRFTDRHGQPQSLLVVSEKRCMIRSMPTLVKLRAAQDRVTARPGDALVCRFRLDRANYRDGMELRLVDPPRGVTAEKVAIGPDETDIQVAVSLARDLQTDRPLSLRFQATGNLPKHLAVVTESTIDVQWESVSRRAPSR
jgi:hypothetical protein